MSLLALELGALIALLTGLWSQVAAFATWLSGWLIVRHRLDYSAAPPLLAFLRATSSRHRVAAMGVHGSDLEYVRPLDRIWRVFHVHTDRSSHWFLAGRRGGPGWRPIRYSFRAGTGGEGSSHTPGDHQDAHLLVISFLRGTVDWHGLLAAVAAWADAGAGAEAELRAAVQALQDLE